MHLTRNGVREVILAAEKLKEKGIGLSQIEAIYSSPLKRTQETAALLRASLDNRIDPILNNLKKEPAPTEIDRPLEQIEKEVESDPRQEKSAFTIFRNYKAGKKEHAHSTSLPGGKKLSAGLPIT